MSLEDFAPAPDDTELEQLSDLIKELMEHREGIETLSELLNDLQGKERQLSQEIIPEKMKELGLSSLSTEDGAVVKIVHKVKASLTGKRKEDGFKWLRENGHGSLIKPKTVQENVHHQTLSAFAREQLALGKPLPECFSVYEYDQTEINQ